VHCAGKFVPDKLKVCLNTTQGTIGGSFQVKSWNLGTICRPSPYCRRFTSGTNTCEGTEIFIVLQNQTMVIRLVTTHFSSRVVFVAL